MKNLRNSSLAFLFVLLISVNGVPAEHPAETPWQVGRIVDVQKNVNSRTLYWIANTPVTQDDISYTISVHLQDKILVGHYDPNSRQPAPPDIWVKDFPVKVQVEGGDMYLKPPTGYDLKLAIVKRKQAPVMRPVAASEWTSSEAKPEGMGDSSSHSMIGLDRPTEGTVQASEAPPPETANGTLAVSTIPFLAEIYVDGKSMGYSPGKFDLPPGKHSVRVEKAGYRAWTKDVTVAAGSDLAVEASLVKK